MIVQFKVYFMRYVVMDAKKFTLERLATNYENAGLSMDNKWGILQEHKYLPVVI